MNGPTDPGPVFKTQYHDTIKPNPDLVIIHHSSFFLNLDHSYSFLLFPSLFFSSSFCLRRCLRICVQPPSDFLRLWLVEGQRGSLLPHLWLVEGQRGSLLLFPNPAQVSEKTIWLFGWKRWKVIYSFPGLLSQLPRLLSLFPTAIPPHPPPFAFTTPSTPKKKKLKKGHCSFFILSWSRWILDDEV